jgi:hypothetical protein
MINSNTEGQEVTTAGSEVRARGRPSLKELKALVAGRKGSNRDYVSSVSRDHSREVIRALAPYACMLTVNFAHPYKDDRFLLDQMNKFLVRLNGELFNRRYMKKLEGTHLTGVCVAEVCRDMGPLNGCLHFHFLLKPCSKFDEGNVEEILWPKVRKVLSKFKDVKGRLMTKATGERMTVHIAPYTGIGTLPNYLTKEYEIYAAEADGLLGVLEADRTGIVGIQYRHKKDGFRDIFE